MNMSKARCYHVPMKKYGMTLLALTALLNVAPAAAVNPFNVDDARVNEPGQCQLEGFVLDRRTVSGHGNGLVLGCTPAQRFQQSEFSLGLFRTDADGQIEQKSLDLAWKGLWKPLDNEAGSLGLGASLGSVRQHQVGQRPLWHPYFNLIVSAAVLDNLVLHANAGAVRDRHAALSMRTWGYSAELQLSGRLTGVAERYRQDADKANQQVGLRYAVLPGRLEFDVLGGRQRAEPEVRRWYSAGLRLFF